MVDWCNSRPGQEPGASSACLSTCRAYHDLESWRPGSVSPWKFAVVGSGGGGGGERAKGKGKSGWCSRFWRDGLGVDQLASSVRPLLPSRHGLLLDLFAAVALLKVLGTSSEFEESKDRGTCSVVL